MNIPYAFHPGVVVRTPRLPLVTSLEGFDLKKLGADAAFMEALYLASPVLQEELLKYCQGKITGHKEIRKLTLSVAKYYLRMSSRCTPFGLFSGCAVAQWDEGPTNILLNESTMERHTRFDMHYLCALAQHLSGLPFVKNRLLYYPNSSAYTIGDEMRYVEYKYAGGKRNHLISSVMSSGYLQTILDAAEKGISFDAMAGLLTGDDISREEAEAFINEMIDAQVLVNELEPAITGDEFLSRIINVLSGINTPEDPSLTALIASLTKTDAMVSKLDGGDANDVSAYAALMEYISCFGVAGEAGKLFQADLSLSLVHNHIDNNTGERLLDALQTLHYLQRPEEHAALQSFIKRFYERYEDREMPLLEVLDTETGIGYLENKSGDILPLVEDLQLPSRKADALQLRWSMADNFLFHRLLKAYADNAYTITLDKKDFSGAAADWSLLPPSMSVMFRLSANRQLVLESAGGSSAVNLLGRFAHGNKAIHRIAGDVARAETANNPGIIMAEIIHLPESRTGNVLLHPAFRDYEIPFLARSSVGKEHQVALQDLHVAVRNNTVRLFSKKLGSEIIPRLSNAHNYSFNALPVYQFLCDLQMQMNRQGLFFSWGPLEPQYAFLPRVVCNGVILSPARWNLDKKDIEPFAEQKGEERQKALAAFRQERKMPALVMLVEGDNELLINLEEELMVDMWLDAVKKRSRFIFKEFLCETGDGPVRDLQGRVYASQFIASLVKNGPAYQPSPLTAKGARLAPSIQSDFSFGSEWVYYKIFCGTRVADKILVAAIRPLVERLLEEGVIDKFFFIRYNQPGFHIRVRFHLTNAALLGRLLQLYREYTADFDAAGFVWKTETDTYKRELDRYGHTTMELTESLFFHDSMAALEMLHATEAGDREEARWLWALRAIDELLESFGLLAAQKLAIVQTVREGFFKEFNGNAVLKEQLSIKYRQYKSKTEAMLEGGSRLPLGYEPLLEILRQKRYNQSPLVDTLLKMQAAGTLEVPLPVLLPSYIHMLVNRVITSSARLHELVLYDMLFVYYKSLDGRLRQQQKLQQKLAI